MIALTAIWQLLTGLAEESEQTLAKARSQMRVHGQWTLALRRAARRNGIAVGAKGSAIADDPHLAHAFRKARRKYVFGFWVWQRTSCYARGTNAFLVEHRFDLTMSLAMIATLLSFAL